jgi:hypothetical protein
MFDLKTITRFSQLLLFNLFSLVLFLMQFYGFVNALVKATKTLI